MRREPFLTPVHFPFTIVNLDQPVIFDKSEPEPLHVEMLGRGPLYTGFIDTLVGGQLTSLPIGHSLIHGLYRCEFCGMVVDEGSDCPGCGGMKMPWAELTKVERECVYCGRTVVGGIVCRGCGARISGLTFRDVVSPTPHRR